jgi:hypothetical protein
MCGGCTAFPNIGSWNFTVIYSVEMDRVCSVSMHCTVLGAAIGFAVLHSVEGK